MHRLSLYVLLILVFLTLSRWPTLAEKKIPFLFDQRAFSHIFERGPVSVMLLDCFRSGLLFKTYYFKLKIVRPLGLPETLLARTNRPFWNKMQSYKGMSVFRKKNWQPTQSSSVESSTPLPPGALYIGDPGYGNWVEGPNGSKVWAFHKSYRNFPDFFHWGDFRPNLAFYQAMQVHQKNKRPFFGPGNEFGQNGTITQSQMKSVLEPAQTQEVRPREHIKKFIFIPPWKI